MIVIFTAGQLGNQIFQYQFVNKLTPNEKIITSKCDYFDIFDYDKSKYIFFNKYARFIFRRIMKFLAKLGLITSIVQDKSFINGYEIDQDSFTIKKGLIDSIKIVEGFFQSQNMVDLDVKVKDQHIQQAAEYLSDVPQEMQKVFVHIRRGDYLEWSVLGKKNPSLPLEYYKQSIDWFINNYDDPFFIFLSNDSDFVEKEFAYLTKKKISKNSVGVDFAIMTLCEDAIISNSTLSWWGANLMKSGSKIFAPKYWLGWQSDTWYPKGIKLNNIEYVKIK